MTKSVVADKSIAFSIRIINLYKYLQKEFVLSKQLLRSGTAIGALIREAAHAQSKPDFLNKMNVALKEANEVDYWLLPLTETNYLQIKEYKSIQSDCDELIKLLVSIVKTTKTKLNIKD